MGRACRRIYEVSCSSRFLRQRRAAPGWVFTSLAKSAKRTMPSSTMLKPNPAPNSPFSARRPARAMTKSQVLVVDDEADIRELLSMTLTRMGLEAHCAATSAEALGMLQKHSYELCLTDMRLTDGDGLAVIDYVAKHRPELPVA